MHLFVLIVLAPLAQTSDVRELANTAPAFIEQPTGPLEINASLWIALFGLENMVNRDAIAELGMRLIAADKNVLIFIGISQIQPRFEIRSACIGTPYTRFDVKATRL